MRMGFHPGGGVLGWPLERQRLGIDIHWLMVVVQSAEERRRKEKMLTLT